MPEHTDTSPNCLWTPVFGDKNILTPACDPYEMVLRVDAVNGRCPGCYKVVVFEEPDNDRQG